MDYTGCVRKVPIRLTPPTKASDRLLQDSEYAIGERAIRYSLQMMALRTSAAAASTPHLTDTLPPARCAKRVFQGIRFVPILIGGWC
ncbi:winged-helix domain-containing protein [Corynebacterium choanae]|uniref:winged-helix domain-containing protein n=1 Tax=Corynebacterium choanae TaxID=1862358 RepID=UPI000F4D9275